METEKSLIKPNDMQQSIMPRTPEEFVYELSEQREKHKDQAVIRWLRISVSLLMLLLVLYVNYQIINIINRLIDIDLVLIFFGKLTPADRAVNITAVMGLITGSVAQIAALFIIAVKFIFPAEEKKA